MQGEVRQAAGEGEFTRTLSFRTRPTDEHLMKAAASAAGESVSEWLRRLARREALRQLGTS